VRKRTVV